MNLHHPRPFAPWPKRPPSVDMCRCTKCHVWLSTHKYHGLLPHRRRFLGLSAAQTFLSKAVQQASDRTVLLYYLKPLGIGASACPQRRASAARPTCVLDSVQVLAAGVVRAAGATNELCTYVRIYAGAMQAMGRRVILEANVSHVCGSGFAAFIVM